MTDQRIDRHAQVLVEYSAGVQPGDSVAITTTTLAIPLVEALYEHVLRRGGHPTAFTTPPRLEEIFLRSANDEQMRRPPFFLEVGVGYFDHIIVVQAPENTRHAGSTDPQRQATMAAGRRALMGPYMEKMMRPEKSVTVSLHPTPALAQDAQMSLLDYQDFVYQGCMLDQPDPLAAWRKLAATQERVRDWLETKTSLEVQGPTVDLRLQIEGRKWISDDGHKNFPGGEIFTSPIEDGVEGHIRFTYPATMNGREAKDVQLWFEQGKVVRAEASAGQDYLEQMLDLDEGARRLGEFAIGTNYGVQRFTGNVLFDEKIGGTCHLAVGRGFANLGSKNESAIHWDMVCDLKQASTISADGEVFYRDGQFTLP
jgi:aminopeptidase